MSVIAQFTVPADQFVLGDLLEVEGEPTVRLESLIPTGDAIVPYFWVADEYADAVETALEQSEIVEEVAVVDETPSEVLFRVAWSEDVDGFLGLVRDADVALLEGEGLGDDWAFRMRFPEREALSAFYQACVDKGFRPELKEVNSPSESSDSGGFGVSDAQREMLLTALEEGYYDVPREINLTELAEIVGISDTAASQRLRRGVATLLSATLARGASSERDDGESERD